MPQFYFTCEEILYYWVLLIPVQNIAQMSGMALLSCLYQPVGSKAFHPINSLGITSLQSYLSVYFVILANGVMSCLHVSLPLKIGHMTHVWLLLFIHSVCQLATRGLTLMIPPSYLKRESCTAFFLISFFPLPKTLLPLKVRSTKSKGTLINIPILFLTLFSTCSRWTYRQRERKKYADRQVYINK